MCSTVQWPRARNAFSSACAARTCPAPDDAESTSTRGLRFSGRALVIVRARLSALALSGGKLFQDVPRNFLDFSKARQIFLELGIQQLCLLRPELVSQNHVAQLHRVRKQRIFLQFFQRLFWIVVVHGCPLESCRSIAAKPCISILRKKGSESC